MTIKITNDNNQIYTDNFKVANSNTKKIQNGNFSNVLNSKLSKTDSLDNIFERAAEKYNVSVDLLKAVAKAESGFNPNAESHAGAQGIMQLMPATARGLGVTNSFDPEQNIMGGAKYLSQMLEKFDGNTELSLAAYNAGPGNVLKYDGIPPFKETQNYVAKVMGYSGQQLSTNFQTNTYKTNASNTAKLNTSTYNAGLSNFNFNSNIEANELLQILQGNGLTDILSNENLTSEDYALLMDLYRYTAQLSMFSDGLTSDII